MIHRGLGSLASVGAQSQEAVIMLPVAMMSDCAYMRRFFRGIAPYFGLSGRPEDVAKKCSAATDPIVLADEVKEKTAGSKLVVVGFSVGSTQFDIETLIVASRYRQCVVAMTLEGYRRFIEAVDVLDNANRNFLGARVIAFVQIGDMAESFVRVPGLGWNAQIAHFAVKNWSTDKCEDIASFIRQVHQARSK